ADIKTVETQENKNREQKQVLGLLLYIKDFSRLNWQYHATKIYELETERNELLNNNDVLAQLEKNKLEVEAQITTSKDNVQLMTEKVGGLKNTVSNYEDQLSVAGGVKGEIAQHDKDRWYPLMDEKLANTKLTLRNVDNRQEDFRKQYLGENGE